MCLKQNLLCQMLNNFDCKEVILKHLKLLAVEHLGRYVTLHSCLVVYRDFLVMCIHYFGIS